MNYTRPDLATIMIIGISLVGAVLIGYYMAMSIRQSNSTPPKQQRPVSKLSAQYGTGITATPSLTADNYTAATQWIQVGIIKTEDAEENTFYPLYEQRIAPNLNLFRYRAIDIDRNNYPLQLPDQPFLENETNIGTIRGLESKGNWIVDRDRNTSWAYT